MRKRIAVIHKDKCNPQGCGNYLCAKLCPVNRAGEDCIKEGDETTDKAVIDEVLCTGCGICPNRCPYGAIEIINLPDNLKKDPIHRYGENTFALFSLPTPLFGKIVGVLGKNGIGKSTAFKILGNIEQANLGQWDKEISPKDVISYFKGTEMQKYMERLYAGNITLSLKPQQVEYIPKQFTGTVRALLEKVDKINGLEHVTKELELTQFLDTEISQVSGGELQRVAIAAAVLRGSDLTLFDEPSSYLDIKQRIKVANFIRTLAKNDKATMVIEHDLIILDFMTDVINIMYGHDSVYGIVSGVKTSREGINAFLEGFLREENVRIRSSSLKFESGVERIQGIPVELTSWKDLSITRGNFSLSTAEGTLYKDEIIGVLGENGTGKSTFIKMLAGELKGDGEISTEVKVSYKPQYLDYADRNETVVEFLSDAMANFELQLIRPLDLEKLYTKKLNQLSGGELQRVVVAKCLSKDAELFLLDEPSAYLDIEQRMNIAKVIKRMATEREVTVLVVDHDMMFLDFLSDRLLVFTGEPAKSATVAGPYTKEEGMNIFLKSLDITLRKDITSRRPRINKPGSVKDREQKLAKKYYSN